MAKGRWSQGRELICRQFLNRAYLHLNQFCKGRWRAGRRARRHRHSDSIETRSTFRDRRHGPELGQCEHHQFNFLGLCDYRICCRSKYGQSLGRLGR